MARRRARRAARRWSARRGGGSAARSESAVRGRRLPACPTLALERRQPRRAKRPARASIAGRHLRAPFLAMAVAAGVGPLVGAATTARPRSARAAAEWSPPAADRERGVDVAALAALPAPPAPRRRHAPRPRTVVPLVQRDEGRRVGRRGRGARSPPRRRWIVPVTAAARAGRRGQRNAAAPGRRRREASGAWERMVGVTGLEPATSRSRTVRSTSLSYTPSRTGRRPAPERPVNRSARCLTHRRRLANRGRCVTPTPRRLAADHAVDLVDGGAVARASRRCRCR